MLRDAPVLAKEAGIGRVDIIVDDRIASSKEVFFPHGIVAGSKKANYF